MNILNFFNPYNYAMKFRRVAYRKGIFKQTRISRPVISIGNLTFGGTGKTPLTILAAEFLEQQLHKRVAVILRGYKRKSGGLLVVQHQGERLSDPDLAGDEALVLAGALPNSTIIVDERRARAAEKAVSLGADVLLLDDAYQHLHLYRDINVLLVDIEEGISSVLPFGTARESKSAIRDADCIVFTNVEDGDRALKVSKKIERFIQPEAIVAALHTVPTGVEMIRTGVMAGLEILDGKKALAVSSIAKPIRFHQMLASTGAIVMTHVLPDHAEYSKYTVERIIEQAERSGAELIVTTTKDIVKARKFYLECDSSVPVLVLHRKIEWIHGSDGFYGLIQACIQHYESLHRT